MYYIVYLYSVSFNRSYASKRYCIQLVVCIFMEPILANIRENRVLENGHLTFFF